MPEKYGSEYMTAMAVGPPFEILDSQTEYPFLPNQNSSEIEEHQIEGIAVRCTLRTNAIGGWILNIQNRKMSNDAKKGNKCTLGVVVVCYMILFLHG